MTSSVRGRGLFGGRTATVTFRRVEGPIRLAGLALEAFAVVPSLRTTTIEQPERGRRIGTVEHLLAALGGLGIHSGLSVDVEGDEFPFLDGGAAQWCAAIDELGARPSPPRLLIAREGEVHVGASRYRFVPPGALHTVAPSLGVTLDFDHPRLVARAEWFGDAHDFAVRIAPARTFVFAHDIAKLADLGMMAHADPESVVVIDERGVHSAGVAASPDEPVRHKLLDLVGDLFLHGGPPEGRIETFRPGHAATHEAVRRAREMGIVLDR